jgi:hypothetical protein
MRDRFRQDFARFFVCQHVALVDRLPLIPHHDMIIESSLPDLSRLCVRAMCSFGVMGVGAAADGDATGSPGQSIRFACTWTRR